MNEVREIDTVLHHVRQAVKRHRLPSDAAITQQILLFGNAFYGYRFTIQGFTAVWSAADKILKIFDPDGKMLESAPLSEDVREASIESIPLTHQRRAA